MIPLSFQPTHNLTPYSSYSKLLAFEISRILWRLGCDVRVFDPAGLPMKDDVQHTHPKVQELRDLSRWSDGHFWVSPEQHGNLVSVCTSFIAPLCRSRSLLTDESILNLRLPFSKTRSIGFRCLLEVSVPPKAGRWQLPRCAVDPSRSMRSTLCVSWVGGCVCLPFRISLRFPWHIHSFRMKVNREINI